MQIGVRQEAELLQTATSICLNLFTSDLRMKPSVDDGGHLGYHLMQEPAMAEAIIDGSSENQIGNNIRNQNP